ncbi:hypothetical protein V6N13_053139 [Hibiscus sabdariffa]|uniref:Serine acetyltransferase N-terminal domain-containing protein n=1 Tax=Hibiscus sabdariffa TaxID=183260 RepID=A0ABR2Q6D4_9ROSI
MGCVSDNRWESFPEMLSTVKETEDGEEATLEPVQFPFEKVFPVYAISLSKPDTDSIVNSGHDPIWDAVREEAKLEAEKEPILSSFLYASILAHDCLEQTLAFVLANRLQNPALLATQLLDIFSHVMMHDRDIQRSIRLDVQAFMDRDPACLSYSSALLYLKGYHSLQSYRVAHTLWKQGRKLLALALQSRITAKIGDGILLDHGTGVVIGETAVVGNRVSLMHSVTLGGTGKETGDRHPKVGDLALLGACVTVLGNINIGEGAMVAAGSLVLKHVPPHSMAAGTPAQVIGSIEEQDPSLTMNHGRTLMVQMNTILALVSFVTGCYDELADATKEFFKHVAVGLRDGRSKIAIGR